WRVHRPDLDPGAVADLGLAGRGVRRGDHRPAGQPAGGAGRRHADRCRGVTGHGDVQPGLGAGGVVLGADRAAAVAAGLAMTGNRAISGVGITGGIVLLALLPLAGLPAFYDSFLYIVFYWMALATSWAILSGFAGYFSFGHAAFFGAGMYTTATLAVKF